MSQNTNERLTVITITTQAHKIGCSCCHLPAAQIVDGAFIWHSQHNGKKHINAISVQDLEALISASRTVGV